MYLSYHISFLVVLSFLCIFSNSIFIFSKYCSMHLIIIDT